MTEDMGTQAGNEGNDVAVQTAPPPPAPAPPASSAATQAPKPPSTPKPPPTTKPPPTKAMPAMPPSPRKFSTAGLNFNKATQGVDLRAIVADWERVGKDTGGPLEQPLQNRHACAKVPQLQTIVDWILYNAGQPDALRYATNYCGAFGKRTQSSGAHQSQSHCQ